MFRAELTVFQKSRLAFALALSVSAAAAGFLVAGVTQPLFLALGLGTSLIATAIWAAYRRNDIWPRKTRALVEADAGGVRVNGELVAPREKLRSGYFQPKVGSKECSVRLQDRFGRTQLEAGVVLESQGVKLLRSLGLDASSRAIDFSNVSPVAATLGRLSVFWGLSFVALLFAILGGHVAIAALLALLHVALLVVPSKIRIGADGVLVKWLGWKTLTPFSEVSAIHAEERASVLQKKNGENVRIYTIPWSRRGGTLAPRYVPSRDAIAARMKESFNAFREGGVRAEVAAMVEPGGRTAVDWMKELRALQSSERDYRKAAVPHDELWRVLEDPAATTASRAGAATALAPTLDEQGRARVRVAAETTASPKLRVALSRVVDSAPDDALAEALDDVLAAEEMEASKRSA